MTHIKAWTIGLLLITFASVSGCPKISDSDQSYSSTLSRLKQLESLVTAMAKAKYDIRQYESLDHFLAACEGLGLLKLESISRSGILRDGKGNEWVQFGFGDPTAASIRIASRSSFRAGASPTLICDFTVARDSEVSVTATVIP